MDLNRPEILTWLRQFGTDEAIAQKLLERLRFVSADEFRDGMTSLILERAGAGSTPIALYAERHIRLQRGRPDRLFKEQGKVRRAYGAGPEPVRAEHRGRPQTGSEGIVANLITQVGRKHRSRCFDHPGPDTIRSKKVRRFVLVTDFLGSGTQASRYLDAAWRVASVKSWTSGKFLSFEVLCFSATNDGLSKVRAHPSKPMVFQVEACPTLSTYAPFEGPDLLELCRRYGPTDSETSIPRLGYGETGALIAFAHGVPNNAPRLIFAKGKRWQPLFEARVTAQAALDRHEKRDAKIIERFKILGESELARLDKLPAADIEIYRTALVLAALKKSPRTVEIVSARTGLRLSDCVNALHRVRAAGWIDSTNRLTEQAYVELEYLRARYEPPALVPRTAKSLYCPMQLRAPEESFS